MIAHTLGRTTGEDPPIRRRILGVRVDDVSWDEALMLTERYVRSAGTHSVVTPNPEIVMAARRDRALLQAVEHADLATPDGVGLRWAGRMLGQPIREVVPGSDLVLGMADRAARNRRRWFLLGAAPGVAGRAGEALAARYPGLVIAGVHGGSPRPEDDDDALRRIESAAPIDTLLVAYGAPGQETWIARNGSRTGIPLAVGVGGTFNFLAGVSKAPPEAAKRLGVIWLWRLVTEPWRWRRQAALPAFVCAVVVEWARSRMQGRSAS